MVRGGGPSTALVGQQTDGEVVPLGVHGVDQADLPGAVPGLQTLLAPYGFVDVAVRLVPDEQFQAVAFGEAVGDALLVFPDASAEAVGDADIEHAVAAARHDVDVVRHRRR
jgi:hypothetical protein